MNVAAAIYLQGVDPIGVPWVRAGLLEREVWQATLTRAAHLTREAK